MSQVTPTSPHRFLSLTTVAAPLEKTASTIDEILGGWSAHGHDTRRGPLDLSILYDTDPVSGGAHPFKVVAFSPGDAAATTAIVTNLADGWNSLSYALSKRLKVLITQVTSTKNGDKYPKHSFEVWRHGERCRVLQVLRDSDKWKFYQHGRTEHFENPDHYRRRRISDRLHRAILIEYLKAIGWDATSESFWRPTDDAIYFEQGAAKSSFRRVTVPGRGFGRSHRCRW